MPFRKTTRLAGITRNTVLAAITSVVVTVGLCLACLWWITGNGEAARRNPSSTPQEVDNGTTNAEPHSDPVDPDPIDPRILNPEHGSEDHESLAAGDCALGVRILDRGSQPIEGAALRLLLDDKSSEASTAADGSAEFLDIADGSYLLRVFTATRPELVTARRLVLHSGERLDVTLVIEDYDLAIAGRVISASGQAITDVRVKARRHFRDRAETDLVPIDENAQIVEVDGDGRFHIDRLDAGEYELRVFGSEKFAPADRLVAAGNLETEIILEEGREVRIVGKITSKDDQPIPSATVTSPQRDRHEVRDQTDRRGEYSIRRIVRPRDTVKIEVRAAGFRVSRRTLAPEEHPEGLEWKVDLKLEKEEGQAWITGTVVDESGNALIGTRLELYSAKTDTRRTAISRVGGLFEIREIPDAADYELRIRPRRGFSDWSRRSLEIDANGIDLNIVLSRLDVATVIGHVVDASGAPVADWGFQLYSQRASARVFHGVTDADGSFYVEDIAAGALVLTSRSAPEVEVRGAEIHAGRDQRVRFVVDLGEYEVHGRLVSADGQPIGDASIELSCKAREEKTKSRSLRSTQSDEDGRFVFLKVGPGTHTLQTSAKGFAENSIEIDPATRVDAVDIILERSE